MITLQNGCTVFVEMAEGEEMGFTNVGTWSLPWAKSISVGTNAPYDTSALRDGAYIVVDSGGAIAITNGPNSLHAGMLGLYSAWFVIGSIVLIRWFWRFTAGAAGLPLSGSE